MSDKYEDIDFTDEYLRELLASEGLLPLERALIEEVISLRDDVKSKSESGHAVSDAWREAHDEAQRNTDLASQETMRVVVESGTAHVRTPARDFYAHTGQTVVVRADGSGGVVWPEETDG